MAKKVFCPDCKEEATPQQMFCSCGYVLGLVCADCGKINSSKNTLCVFCGCDELIDPREAKTKKRKEEKSRMKRLCLRDGCDTRIEGYQHYCPSKDCDQNQELKFKFRDDNRVFDGLNCKRCWSYEKGLDKFFIERNDDTFFRTVEHPNRYVPETTAEVLKQARLYECPACKQRGEAEVKQWVLIPESKTAKAADAFMVSLEKIGDWIKRGFKAAKAAREKQLEITKKRGGKK